MKYNPLQLVRIKDIDRVGVILHECKNVPNMYCIGYYIGGTTTKGQRYTYGHNIEALDVWGFTDDMPF
jgi:hypothetical protein